MKAVLLTRRSEFQIFCANALWQKGLVHGVIVEEGYSFERGSGLLNVLDIVRRNTSTILAAVVQNPASAVDYARLLVAKTRYLGSQELHNARLLRLGYQKFADALPVVTVEDINSDCVRAALVEMGADVVLVFGTRFIKAALFGGYPVPFVNLHWGWSPDYRGEGIVSALACEGVGALGVTVHLLNSAVDGGDILYRARPNVDSSDNFYSIGLKLTLLGIDLFTTTLDDYRRRRALVGQPQDLSKGHLFTTKYMKTHPGLYHRAWRNLKSVAASDGERAGEPQ